MSHSPTNQIAVTSGTTQTPRQFAETVIGRAVHKQCRAAPLNLVLERNRVFLVAQTVLPWVDQVPASLCRR